MVIVELYEFRLHPPGNRWLWEGVCAAHVNVIETDSFDPDVPADVLEVTATFPNVTGLDRSAATAQQIEFGLLAEFVKRTAWLFHLHEEPKYPDKYRPEVEK